MKFQLIPQNSALQTIEADISDKSRIQIGGAGTDLLLEIGQEVEGTWLEVELTDSGYLLSSSRSDVLVNDLLASTPLPIDDGDLVQIGEELFSFALPEKEESSEKAEEIEESAGEEAQQDLSEKDKELLDTIANEGTDRDRSSEESFLESDDDIFAASHSSGQSEGMGGQGVQGVEVDLETSHWLLKVLTGPNSGAQMNLQDGKSYLVGSDSSCDIVLTDLSVSKKHLSLTPHESGMVEIEDLSSRNGVLISGEKIQGKVEQENSALITAGATTFMVVDRLKEQQTIVTPSVMPQENVEKTLSSGKSSKKKGDSKKKTEKKLPFSLERFRVGKKALFIGLGALFALTLSYTVISLFDEETVIIKRERGPGQLQQLTALLEEYPHFEFQFTEATGTLELSGHILTQQEKNQITSRLKALPFIQKLDTTNLVVDEIVWQQFNFSLEKNFQGVSLSGEIPGEFLLSGTIRTQAQAEDLNRYLSVNFPYNQLLINRVIVEEQLSSAINDRLQKIAPNELLGELNNGELVLVGTVAQASQREFEEFLGQLRTMPGISSVRNLVVEQTRDDGSGYIDISDQYEVTGFSKEVDANVNIIINGRILKRGDTIDQMTIISIRPKFVILERDKIQYRIQYNL